MGIFITTRSVLLTGLVGTALLPCAAQEAVAGKTRNSLSRPVIHDLNRDGKADLIRCFDQQLSVALGSGDGRFATEETYAIGSGRHTVAIADVNADGIPDVLVLNSESDDVTVLAGAGDGRLWSGGGVTTGREPVAFEIADMNRDGHPDLIVASGAGRSIEIHMGAKSGHFEKGAVTSLPFGPSGLAIADINGDGRSDVVVSSAEGESSESLLGDGNGGLQAAQKERVASAAGSGVAATGAQVSGKGQSGKDAAGTEETNKALIPTSGGVVFGGIGGELDQDTPNFFYSKASQALGLRTTNPAANFHVAGVPNAGSRILQASPAEAAAKPFAMTVAGFDNPGDTRRNQVARIGWNLNVGGGQIDYTDGAIGLEWESHYAPDSNRYFEHHMTYVSPGGEVHRPTSWMINKATNFIDASMRFNKMSYFTGGVAPAPTSASAQSGPAVPTRVTAAAKANGGNTSSAFVSNLSGQTFTQWLLFTPYQINMNGNTAFISNTNNVPMFFQLNSTASQYIALVKADNNDRVVLAPGGNTARVPGALNIGSVEDAGLRRAAPRVLAVSDGGAGNGSLLAGTAMLSNQTTTPAAPTAGAQANLYVKNGKLVVQYNDGGAVKYRVLDLASTNANWTYTTVAP